MAGKKLKKSGQKLIPSLNSQTYLNSSDTELNQEWTNVISLYTELQRLMQTCSLNSETLHNKKKIPNTLESGGLHRELGNSRSKSTKGGVKLSRNIVRKNKVVCKHQLKTFQKLSSTDTSCNKSKCVIAKSNARIIKPSEIQANATSENVFKNKEPDPLIFIKEETNILQDANPNKLENNPEKPCPIGRKEVNFCSKDGVSSPRLADSSQPQYSKYDSNSQKSNSKYKVSKSTMLYVQKELSTLKSQIDQTPYLHLREEIISNKSLTDIEHKYLIESIDEQLEKLKSIEKEIDDLIHELKHSVEGGKDYSLSNGGPAEKNNCLKMESSKNEITFQERLKYIEEILQNELIRIQTALKENEELTESTSKETKNYLKITTGARKRHRERAAKDRSNAKKESFIEKFRRRFSDKKKNSLNTRKK